MILILFVINNLTRIDLYFLNINHHQRMINILFIDSINGYLIIYFFEKFSGLGAEIVRVPFQTSIKSFSFK